MHNSGIGVGGNANVSQHVVSADVDKSASGQKSFRKVSVVDDVVSTLTKGAIKSEGSGKLKVKTLSLGGRSIRACHQFRKSWLKFSPTQAGMFENLKDSELKQGLLKSISEHNRLVDQLDIMATKINNLEEGISQFEKDYGDLLAFREKTSPGRSDLKIGKSFLYPGADGQQARITFTSPDKTARTNDVKSFHNGLKSDPKIKSHFEKYFQKKHELAVHKEKMSDTKEELYKIGEKMKRPLRKAITQLYKENDNFLKSKYKQKKDEIKLGLEQKVSFQNESVISKESDLANSVEKQREVSENLRKNSEELSKIKKDISTKKSPFTNFVVNLLKKIVPKSQQATYFKDTAEVENAVCELLEPLKVQQVALQEEAASLKKKEDTLIATVKKNKSDVWNHQADTRGISKVKRLAERKLGLHIPVGRQTGGEIGKIKSFGKKQLALQERQLSVEKMRSFRNRLKDMAELQKVARGKASEVTDARYRPKSREEDGERGLLIVQKLLQGSYSGKKENKWKSEIMKIINDRDQDSLEVIEQNIKGWSAEDGGQEYQHILKFIEENRKDT